MRWWGVRGSGKGLGQWDGKSGMGGGGQNVWVEEVEREERARARGGDGPEVLGASGMDERNGCTGSCKVPWGVVVDCFHVMAPCRLLHGAVCFTQQFMALPSCMHRIPFPPWPDQTHLSCWHETALFLMPR